MAFQREPQACQLRHAAPTMSPTSSRTNPATARRIAAPKPARPHLSSLRTSFSHPFRSPASPASHLLSNLVRQHQSLHHPASVLSSQIHRTSFLRVHLAASYHTQHSNITQHLITCRAHRKSSSMSTCIPLLKRSSMSGLDGAHLEPHELSLTQCSQAPLPLYGRHLRRH
jgi:hypothetical protein